MDLVLWDFDWSLINENSDVFVVNEFGDEKTREIQNKYRRHRKSGDEEGQPLTWTQLMREVMRDIGVRRRIRRGEIEALLRRLPVFEEIVDGIGYLAKRGARQEVISDANSIFIETFLDSRDLLSHFSFVRTHLATWTAGEEETEVLHVAQRHGEEEPAHFCDICPPHLCKGIEVEKSLSVHLQSSDADKATAEVADATEERRGNSRESHRIVYVGDGFGDFCALRRLLQERERRSSLSRLSPSGSPSLSPSASPSSSTSLSPSRLPSSSPLTTDGRELSLCLCVRKGYHLEKVLSKHRHLLPEKAEEHIFFWEDGKELMAILQQFLS